jgi:2'-5' RNA ligase
MRGWLLTALWLVSQFVPSDEYVPLSLIGKPVPRERSDAAHVRACPPHASTLRPPASSRFWDQGVPLRSSTKFRRTCLKAAPRNDDSKKLDSEEGPDPRTETSFPKKTGTGEQKLEKKRKNPTRTLPGSLGAICVVPPVEIRTRIEALRAQMDGNRSLWMPQVSLLFFFLKPEEVSIDGLREAKQSIESGMKDFPPFNLTMDEISVHLHRNEWAVWISPKKADSIRTLQMALSELFPRYGEIAPTGSEFLPHISLGTWPSRSDAIAALERAKPTFEPISWEVANVDIMTSPGAGTPFTVWHETGLSGQSKEAPASSQLLMEAKQEFWSKYQNKKEMLIVVRQLIKVKSSLERLERQNFARLQRLMNTFTASATSERKRSDSSKSFRLNELPNDWDLGEGIAQDEAADDTESSEDVDGEVLQVSGSSTLPGTADETDIPEDDDEDGGDDEILQEGDDEGVLLRVGRGDAFTQRRQEGGWGAARTAAGPNDSGANNNKKRFLRLTRRVLEDLQATAMWGAQGVGADTVDLESLGRNVAKAGLNKATTLTSTPPKTQQQQQQQRKADRGRTRNAGKGAKNKAAGKTEAQKASATSILLLRHGQSTWNAEGRWQGQADMPLSQLGFAQSALAAVRLGSGDLTSIFGAIHKK